MAKKDERRRQEREAKWEAMQTQRSLTFESTREEDDDGDIPY